MVQPRYGFVFNRKPAQTQPAVVSDMSSVFITGVSEDAVGAVLPLGSTVWFNSGDVILLAGMGTGDIADSIVLLNAQLKARQVAARVAIHRVAKGASDAETIHNLLGNQANKTGIFAALDVSRYGFVPRLLMVAGGYTGKALNRSADSKVVTQSAKFGGNTGTGLMTLAAPAAGVGVQAGTYRFRCKTAAANGGIFSAVGPDGTVLADATVGVAYTGQVKFTIADGTGTGSADFVVGDGFDVVVSIVPGVLSANPIVAALPQIENALAAHSVVDGPNTTLQDGLDFRATISSDHTILVDFAVTPSAALAGTYVAGAACAVGIGVGVDFENDGVPSQSWANQPIAGITALKRYDTFSLNDGATEGQELLAQNIGIAEPGSAGDPAAVADAGFVLICFGNCSPDPAWQFFNVTRLRDYIHLQAQRLWRSRIGKTNITVHGIQAVMNDLIQLLIDLKSAGHIIDFRVGFDANANSPSTIEAGGIRVYFKAEEASPLLLITTDSYRYPDALTGLIQAVAGETNTLLSATTATANTTV